MIFTLLPPININAASNNSQTAYENISEFQKARWAEIENKVFGVTSLEETAANLVNQNVLDNNNFFNWTSTNLTKWNGNSTAVTSSYNQVYNYKDVYTDYSTSAEGVKKNQESSVTYKVYDVSTPQQFRWAMEQCVSTTDNTTNIKINIKNDLDFNGQGNKQWTPLNRSGGNSATNSIYIEGNGHTLYNLKIYSASGAVGLFGNLNKRLIVKNMGFRSSMVLGKGNCGLIYGYFGYASPNRNHGMTYIYNVHSDSAYMQSDNGKIGGLVGENSAAGNMFIENCSTQNYYIYGLDHIAGIAAYTQLADASSVFPSVKYNAEMPSTPEAFVYQPETTTPVYPVVIENSYSVDCELFSTGSDSGSFISCGQSLIVRNCFTNNTIYAGYNTGGFIGRCAYPGDSRPAKMYDDAGQRSIGNYFENCYSTGIVEGKSAMGGFTGLDNTYRALQNIYADPTKVYSANSLTWFKYGSTEGSTRSIHNSTEAGSTVYKNCYSTAMVGMDYAGKYIGGFIGLDENYTLGTTVNINGENVTANGSFYINCYAAGEVGNILTVTNKDRAETLETSYLSNDEGRDTSDDILDYYPTGGFIGVISPDVYWYEKTYGNMLQFNGVNIYKDITYASVLPEEIKNYNFGYFENCFYDMQTTAMHEMAVGMRNVKAFKDKNVENKDTFSLTGITGIYTEASEIKRMDGLTDFPSGPNGYAMDKDGSNSAVWNYVTDYYPQLKIFMLFDLDGSGNLATLDNKAIPLSTSPFYIPETESTTDGSESHEVAGFDSKSEIITAYRYSQASTATVLLNHWDYRMNTASGGLSTDNDWACAVEDNKLTYNEATGYFETTYNSLAAGEYEFKIQANNSMAYNYGADKFDGKNCVLNVPSEDCDVTIKFKYNGLRSNDYQIYAVMKNSEGNWIDENGNTTDTEKLILLGGTETQVVSEVWTIAGSFPYNGWNVTNTDWDMQLSGESDVYTHTHYIEPDKDSDGNFVPTTYQFKIAKDHKWDESYGVSGKSDNMGFTLTKPCSVTFKFNSKTHITTVTADNPDCITDISTEEKVSFDFKGYSVIGQQSLTGYNWLQAGSELAAAEKGRMTETATGSGIYKVTFDNVKMNQNYAYKVIKDAVDEGSNSYFYINPHTENENAVCSVTFTYNSMTGETTVSAKTADLPDEEFAMQSLQATYYTVLGSETLTGYHWLGDQDHPKDQSEESKEQYRLSAIRNGRMDVVPGTSLYRKTFQNIPAGTYEFKVAADGSLDLSWGENDSTENYKFELKDSADVTITFNQAKGMISVSTDPAESLDTKVYVVTGTENLMGETWNTENAVMTYNEEDGVYEYIKRGVKSGDNYAFKVIEYGNDSGDNISFYLGGDKSEYDIRFTYNPKNDITLFYALDTEDGTDVSDSVIKEVQITSYSVLGDKGLTGYNWLGLLDNGKPGEKADEIAASEAGAMTQNPDGTYTKVYTDIKVGRNGETLSYPFKIAANGNWDSGISYGDGTGDNYYLLLNGDMSNVSVCDVTINFDPSTGKITVETSPADCNLTDIDDSKFTWYVVGDYQLVSFDSFKAPTTVYDTVRDITSGFEFTSGKNSGERGVTWQINSERNSISEFYSKLGNGTGFSLDYTVDGNNSTGTFNTPVVDLLVDVLKDEYIGARPDDNIAHYYVDSFMPGKQWLSISALGYGYSQQYNDWKSNYLAYMAYLDNLEKFEESAEIYYKVLSGSTFNGASINDQSTLIAYMKYLRDSGDPEKVSYYNDLVNDYGDILAYYQIIESPVSDPGVSPTVTDQSVVGSRNLRLIPTVYLEAGNDAEVSVYENSGSEAEANSKNIVRYDENSSPDVNFTNIKDNGFSYYNFAFTAGYAITDKIGLGIYDNYINQGRTSGNYGIKKFNNTFEREQDTTDERTYGTYYAMTSAFTECSSYVDTASENMGLIADSLVKQSVIGSSYDYNSDTNPDAENRQYGQTIVKIYRVNDEGVNSKINMSASANENSAEYINYQKWTGQTKFTADDRGLYNVVFYWALSDGRYLSDSKLVTINVLQPGITKKVDVVYDDAGDGNTLTYNVTYTNSDFSSPVTFAILDVLPYLGDTRIGYGDESVSGTTGSDVSFNLKSLKITQSGAATIRGVYYSQDKNVRNYLTGSSGAATNAAENLNVDGEGLINPTGSSWKNIIRADVGGGGTYTPTNANNVTAISVSGVQLAVAESITVSVTLEYNGKANDVYVNNTFFYARDTDQNIGMNGYSKPVTTTIVGRSLNGYVWLDKDIDGFVDEAEERLKNVTMSLYLLEEGTDNYADTGLTTITDDSGYYSFDKLSSGTYKVVILKEKNEKINDKRFEDYEPTKKLLEARTETVVGSRNLASADKDDKENITSYNVSTIMPSAAEIYRGSYTNKINAVCDGFKYAKSYLNFGIIDSASKCSITLNKLGEDGNPLNGVIFKLEHFDTDTGKWILVSYDENGYIIKDSSEEGEGMSSFTTGGTMPDGSKSDGIIVLPNLPEGKYRITEISTVEGYNLLASSIEVELPYKLAVGVDNNSIISTPSEPSYTENGYNYYRDITFTITNTTNLNDLLPLTGVNEFNWLIIAGVVLVLAGVGIFFFVSKKKKKSPKHSA
ncbi:MULTISPECIES: SpaA isopeptide-forming pilin-related protein [unclassified Ruminococcus]|uniref:pullulanase X25 domain-containing protein n=1 Tax=unclassified Ruminococcus TaxID=2608920 RepID=UPI0021098FE2|nr:MULTISPECIES: SpaA isopeptide-forming pilin-related protein [unclassified Ruminococcus]